MVSGVNITKIQEVQRLDAGNKVAKRIILTYMVGTNGPFTEEATIQDFQSGAARQRIELFASTVNSHAPMA